MGTTVKAGACVHTASSADPLLWTQVVCRVRPPTVARTAARAMVACHHTTHRGNLSRHHFVTTPLCHAPTPLTVVICHDMPFLIPDDACSTAHSQGG